MAVTVNGKPVATVGAGDAVIFFNFRPTGQGKFPVRSPRIYLPALKGKSLKPLFCGLTQYDVTFNNVRVAFNPQNLKNTLGNNLSAKGYRQLRIAETEKYAHVTFFFNGGVEKPNINEDRILISSPRSQLTTSHRICPRTRLPKRR
jgi:2,3-bisphosphoglycerate-independent phosphoglycerate mutase